MTARNAWRSRRAGAARASLPVAMVTVMLLGLTVEGLQQPAPSTGEGSGEVVPVRTFASDAGIILNPIKFEATADFELVMGKLKEALASSEDPKRQEQAAGWKVFRSQEPGPSGSVLYVMVMDPAVQGGEYAVSKILSEAFPTEVQELYQKFSDAYASGQSLLNLDLVSNFSAP